MIISRKSCLAAAVAFTALASFPVARAGNYLVLHSFKGGTDGRNPEAGLASDDQGNFYGTTGRRQKNPGKRCSKSCGGVYGLINGGDEQPIYQFQGGDDGSDPSSTVLPLEGGIYGTTTEGGLQNAGTIFKVKGGGSEKLLYSFCTLTNCADGGTPSSGLIADSQDNLYGETLGPAGGVVFKFSAATGKYKVLYTFCQQVDCSDGNEPHGGLLRDGAGNLFGTTFSGGTGGGVGGDPCSFSRCGTVFRITPDGTQTVLYDFCSKKNCVDGWEPVSKLVLDGSRNLYGVTIYGGHNVCENTGQSGCGTIYKLSPDGALTTLYHFCDQHLHCPDAPQPYSGVIFDKSGNLYGTTITGGANGHGTAYQLAPDGTFKVLYDFCSEANCEDGYNPISDLLRQGQYLFGTTLSGGKNGVGVIFRLRE